MTSRPLPSPEEPIATENGKGTTRWRAWFQRVDEAVVAAATAAASAASTAAGAIMASVLTTRGDILYRNATVPARLAKGTAGHVLTMGADDPAWSALPATGWTLIGSGNLPAANVLAFTSITARKLLLKVSGASSDTASRYLLLRYSINNGASYVALSYAGFYVASGVIADIVSSGNVLPNATVEAAASVADFIAEIATQSGITSGWYTSPNSQNRLFSTVPSSVIASPIDAIQIIWNGTGNFDAGTYELYGL